MPAIFHICAYPFRRMRRDVVPVRPVKRDAPGTGYRYIRQVVRPRIAFAAQRALYCRRRFGGAAGTQQGHRFVHRIQKAFIQFHGGPVSRVDVGWGGVGYRMRSASAAFTAGVA